MIERRNSHKIVVIIILTILVLALSGLCSYLMFFKEEKVKCKEENNTSKKENSTEYKIEVYGKKYETGAYYICNHQSDSDDCKETLFSIKTNTPNAYIIHTNLAKDSTFQYIVYYDKEVKLYNIKDESIKTIEIDLNGNIEWIEDGFIYSDSEEAYYYDLKDNKKIFDKYNELLPVEDTNDPSYLDNLKYLYGKKGKSSNLIDFKTGNIIITIDNSNYENVSFIKEGSYIIVSLNSTEKTEKVIYNTKGDKKVELKDNQTYEINGSKLVLYEESLKKVKEY